MVEHHWRESCCQECEADISWCDYPPKQAQLYPKPPRSEPDLSHRPWGVKYELIYDGGGVSKWTQYYHTKLGARISAWLHYHLRSWGGSAILIDNRPEEKYYG